MCARKFLRFATIAGAVAALPAIAATAFIENQRANSLTMEFATDTFATSNALGGAITGLAQSQIQPRIDTGVVDGSTSVLFEFLGLTDLTGTTQAGLSIGVMNGAPQKPVGNPATYSGTSDLDWWYTPDPSELGPGAVPTSQLAGSIVAKALSAGPGRIAMSIGGIGLLRLSSVSLAAIIGGVSMPTISGNGFPPGHLPAEHVDPALQTFASVGDAGNLGQLRGNVSAASLAAAVPIPPALLSTGAAACSRGYTVTNSWLDLLVSGCTFAFLQIVHPTQPDQVDPTAPVAGAGPPYTLSASVGSVVNTCRDKNNAVVNLATCLNAAAYSAYFKFTSDRVIVQYADPSTCTYAVSPPDLSNRPAAGGAAVVTVTTSNGCPVAVTSYQPWVTVNSITPNGATTTVSLQIAANAGGPRSTAMQVADRLFLVTQ